LCQDYTKRKQSELPQQSFDGHNQWFKQLIIKVIKSNPNLTKFLLYGRYYETIV